MECVNLRSGKGLKVCVKGTRIDHREIRKISLDLRVHRGTFFRFGVSRIVESLRDLEGKVSEKKSTHEGTLIRTCLFRFTSTYLR